jgi:hypothetical protein
LFYSSVNELLRRLDDERVIASGREFAGTIDDLMSFSSSADSRRKRYFQKMH